MPVYQKKSEERKPQKETPEALIQYGKRKNFDLQLVLSIPTDIVHLKTGQCAHADCNAIVQCAQCVNLVIGHVVT